MPLTPHAETHFTGSETVRAMVIGMSDGLTAPFALAEVFRNYGVPENVVADAAKAISAKPATWVDFMMRFELGLEAPDPGRARRSALTIALSYIAGGLVPLSPHFFASTGAGDSSWPGAF